MEKQKTNIYTKLLAFQKLGISVVKDATNPHFKSKYCSLNEVLDKVKKPLNDLGVLILFTPQSDGLGTTLYDTESNTEVTSFMKYVGNDNAQKTLACNTYFRRGSIVSLLGLEDSDDDGNEAVQPPARKVEQKVEQGFVDNPIDTIKACKSVAELTSLYNRMPISQQKAEHLISIFAAKRKELNQSK